jgi:thioredoxin reductase
MTASVDRTPRTGSTREVDVLIVGGGPAGLAASLALQSAGVHVVLIERERSLGGIPRHSRHTGYGLRDLHRVMSGPAYAAQYAALAQRAGVEIHLNTMATDWSGDGHLITTSPAGVVHWAPKAVLLATGCRERPRSARLVPGDRPAGVLTTGTLQQLADLFHLPIGERAVVVGAEHVSFSAVHTLLSHGVAVAAVVTDQPASQSYALLRALASGRHRLPLHVSTDVVAIVGTERVRAVELEDRRSHARWPVPCDTVVFTGSWVPDHELARTSPVAMAGPHPRVDQWLRTTRPGLFAAGNLVHAAEPADVCALGGRQAARSIMEYLTHGEWPERGAELVASGPFTWVHPSRLTSTRERPTRGRLLTRVGHFLGPGVIELVQADRVLHAMRRRRLVPNRSISVALPASLHVDLAAGPVELRWRQAR